MNRINLSMAACALAFLVVSPVFAADMPAVIGSLLTLRRLPAGAVSTRVSMARTAGARATGAAPGANSPAGALFGATLGFNGQAGAFVFGAEGDIDGNWMRDSNSTGTGFCSSPGCRNPDQLVGTARGRVGYAFDRALFYVTAGAAFGDVQMTALGGTATADRTGWTAGLGLEYAFLGPWSAKIEYLYADLGSASCGPAVCGTATTVTFNTNIIRLGVNYRFW